MPPRRVISTTRARPSSRFERQRVDAGAVVEEVPRRVDVRAGVRAHDEARDVRAAAVRDALDRLQLELGIAGVGRHAGRQRHADVQQFRHARHKGAMIPFGASKTARMERRPISCAPVFPTRARAAVVGGRVPRWPCSCSACCSPARPSGAAQQAADRAASRRGWTRRCAARATRSWSLPMPR